MRWAWTIGKVAGIDIKIHATFLLILIWVGAIHWFPGHDWFSVWAGVSFVLAVFACVVLHELGHALMARRFGIRTRDITLLPIGGLARLERMPDEPRQEIWVAIAGPAVNVVIASGLFLAAQILAASGQMGHFPLLERLMWVNLILVGFNLLPAFPMDGGRILRGLLATRLSYARATRIAANFGQAMAFMFGVVGFVYNPLLILIAAFVWIGASQEAALAEMKSAMGGVPVERAMLTQYASLSAADPLSRAVDLIVAGGQEDFPVVDHGRVVGVLTRNDLVLGLSRFGDSTRVEDVMQQQFPTVDASETLDAVLWRLQSSNCKIVPVTRFGELVGVLRLDDAGEFITIRSAVDGTRRAA